MKNTKKKKRSGFLVVILIIVILVSLIAIILLPSALFEVNLPEDWVQLLIYIPIITLLLSLSILIAHPMNRRHQKKISALENRLSMWNTISYRVKKAGETAFNRLPIGIIVIDNDYKVVWANNHARNIFMAPLQNTNLRELNLPVYDQMISTQPDENGNINFVVNLYGGIYKVEYSPQFDTLYFANITEHENLRIKYNNRVTAIGYINVDNLDETLSEFYVSERTKYQGEIINAIQSWADSFGVYVKAYSDSKYMILMDKEQLGAVVKDNFTILDNIKTLFTTSRIVRITLTIGIACADVSINDLAEEAQQQLDMALNRGGDQAVVKIDDKYLYFGAKTDPVQKESRVGIRNKSEELQALIKQSSTVYAIGHRNLDADGFAATLAIYRLAKSMDKEAYIILDQNSMDSTVHRIYDTIKREYVSLTNDIISPSKVSKVDRNSLLMIVDCQTEQQLADSKFIKKFDRVGVIDHHRKGAGGVQNLKYYYTSPSASSSVELISGLFEFCEKPLDFNELEATILLLGVVVDTNNFVYRTSATTFEIASKLQKYGADMNIVKTYLKEDYNDKLVRNKFINNMELYRDRVAIAFSEESGPHERATLAKVSDELISISGVELGITVGYIGEKEVGLSARSLGNINCQMIMERMGGGGHLNNAAAQRKNQTVKEVISILKEKLDSYLEEDGTMKVILIKENKKFGKKNDIIEVAPGHGQFLIKNGIAIIASPENVKALEKQQAEENDARNKEIQLHLEEKEKIESKQLQLKVRVGVDGKLFGSITSKQIAEAIEEQFGVKVEKRKIEVDSSINAVGEHTVKVQLHQTVVAKVVVYVTEAE